MSNLYDAANTKDNENRKFQPDAEGNVAVNVKLGTGVLGSFLQGVKFDYIKTTYPTAIKEIYTYQLGGPTGPVVAVIEVQYTDSTKEFIDDVWRTT